jgi:UDP-galactopyranose mutase
LVVDRRNHIAGNAFDHYDDAGVLIHKYGPHIFTPTQGSFDHLSLFAEWRQYQHWVKACVDGQMVPMPINLDTINTLYGLNLNSMQVDEFSVRKRNTSNR